LSKRTRTEKRSEGVREVVPLREYFEAEIRSVRESMNTRFETIHTDVETALKSQQNATDKAERSLSGRLDGMNEFRESLNDQSRTQMPRLEAEKLLNLLMAKIDENSNRLNARESRGRGMSDQWGYLVGIAGLLIAIASFFFRVSSH
jgi:hypothetical protein